MRTILPTDQQSMHYQGLNHTMNEQLKMMKQIQINTARASDELFAKTGIEEIQLTKSIQEIGLEHDEDFK